MEYSSNKIGTLSLATSVSDCSGLEVQSFSESRAKEPVPDASCGTSHAVTKRARGKKTFNPTFVKCTFHLDRVSVLVLCCAYVFNIY